MRKQLNNPLRNGLPEYDVIALALHNTYDLTNELFVVDFHNFQLSTIILLKFATFSVLSPFSVFPFFHYLLLLLIHLVSRAY